MISWEAVIKKAMETAEQRAQEDTEEKWAEAVKKIWAAEKAGASKQKPVTMKKQAREENAVASVHLSEGSGRKQTNNQHQMTTVVSGGLPLRFWYQTFNRCGVHAFG